MISMHKIFISYSFAKKEEFRKLNTKLRNFLKSQYDIDAYSFVFDFKPKVGNKLLMKKALQMIDESDYLIAELSYKSIGVGLEAGYAKARGKKLIYIHKKNSELSTTVDGIADWRIEYDNTDNLLQKIDEMLKEMFIQPPIAS